MTAPAGTEPAGPDAPAAPDATAAPGGRAFTAPLPLTRPPVLIGLLAAVLLLGSGIYIAASTTAPAREVGSGIVVNGGTFIPAVAPTDGQLAAAPIAVGTAVAAGQPVADLVGATGARVPVVAPAAGTVVAVAAVSGEVVTQGQPLVQLANTSAPLEVTAFLPIEAAAAIRTGMPARVYSIDSDVNASSYTTATVADVGRFVPTEAVVSTLVGSPALVPVLTGNKPVVAVSLAFPGDPTDPAGVRWTGAAPQRFGNGSVVTVDVITGERSVLSLMRSG